MGGGAAVQQPYTPSLGCALESNTGT